MVPFHVTGELKVSPECRLRLSWAEADRARGGEGREDGFEGVSSQKSKCESGRNPTHTHLLHQLSPQPREVLRDRTSTQR